MPRIIVSEFVTLDGVMQAPGNPDEDRSGGFQDGGWQLAFFDDVLGSFVMDGLAATGAFLLGRNTYEIFAAHWPKQPADDPLAGTFNDLPKHVVSTTLRDPLEWQNSRLIAGDVPGEIRKLKEGSGKDITVIGSGTLVATLAEHGLVDEYRLMIHPIVLGRGKRLFRDGTSSALELRDSRTTATGVVIATYAPRTS
jgi:dihydrofolate reductase